VTGQPRLDDPSVVGIDAHQVRERLIRRGLPSHPRDVDGPEALDEPYFLYWRHLLDELEHRVYVCAAPASRHPCLRALTGSTTNDRRGTRARRGPGRERRHPVRLVVAAREVLDQAGGAAHDGVDLGQDVGAELHVERLDVLFDLGWRPTAAQRDG
jgi:hypothetical protein